MNEIHEWFVSRGWCWSVGFGGGIREIQARCWKPPHPWQNCSYTETGKTIEDAIQKLQSKVEAL